jgi:hypothetical protein
LGKNSGKATKSGFKTSRISAEYSSYLNHAHKKIAGMKATSCHQLYKNALRHISTGVHRNAGGVKEVASHRLFVVMLLMNVINNNSKVQVQSLEVFKSSG